MRTEKLQQSLSNSELNYYEMRNVAIKKWDNIPIDQNGILYKNLQLKNTVKELNYKLKKLNEEKEKKRILT